MSVRTVRLVAPAALLLWVVAALPATAAPRDVVELAGRTTIHATAPRHALLRVPRDLALADLRSRITGGGRVAGWALTDRAQEESEDPAVVVHSFVFNRCSEPGCPAAEQLLTVRHSEGLENGVIPRGTYHLYVVADGAPVTISFTARGLGGETVARPRSPAQADVRTLTPNAASSPDGTIVSAGDFTELEPGRGLGLLGLWALGSDHVTTAFGDCFYFSDTLVPAPAAAFPPGCPLGFSHRPRAQVPAAPGSRDGLIYKSTYSELPLGIGGWAVSAARVEDFGAVGLWLRY